MSKDVDTSPNPLVKKSRKPREKSEEKSSKKRKRLEAAERADTPVHTARSPSKKARLNINGEESSSQIPITDAPSSPEGGLAATSVDLESRKQAKEHRKQKRRKEKHVSGEQVDKDKDKDKAKVQDIEEEEGPSQSVEGSPFFTQSTSFYLALSPIAQASPLHGLCAEHLSPLILTYSRALNGVVLSYSNPRFSSEPPTQHGEGDVVLSRANDEYGVTFAWVTADFVVLRPQRNSWIKGYVSVQSDSHIGLVCWNLFNASIGRKDLPKEWRWVRGESRGQHTARGGDGVGRKKGDKEGHWVDGNGDAVEGPLRFRVRDFDSVPAFGKDKSFMSIEGTLRPEEEEEGENEAEAGRDGQQVGKAGQERLRKLQEAKAEKRRREGNARQRRVDSNEDAEDSQDSSTAYWTAPSE